MKKRIICLIVSSVFLFQFSVAATAKSEDASFSLDGLNTANFSSEAKKLLEKNGFVVVPGREKEMFEIYSGCKNTGEPIFVTTDAVLHTSHTFFDYLLRILEVERLYDVAVELTDRMLDLSLKQYSEAEDSDVKEAAILNFGFFAVAKKQFDPSYETGINLGIAIQSEIDLIKKHEGIRRRPLLTYVKGSPAYALEDYSQYVPRGHYTRNEKLQSYFKAMMWYGRIDFKLKPGDGNTEEQHGQKMTLQAVLMADALLKDKDTYELWKMLYEPTVYFVGKTDDLCVDDYMGLAGEVFGTTGHIDRYADRARLNRFIEKALQLKSPGILSNTAYTDKGEFALTTKGFRFMGQRFIPDSYIFQELVYGKKGDKEIMKYTGKGRPLSLQTKQTSILILHAQRQ